MQKRSTPFVLCFVFLVVLFVAPIHGSERIERGLAEAQKAQSAGDLDTAYQILHQLLLAHPESESVNFAYGIVTLARGNASQAELAFTRVLQLNPGNQRARLEQARAMAALHRFAEATAALDTVLAANIPNQVRKNVEAYRNRLRNKSKSNKNFSGQVEVGVFHDTNVNAGPDGAEVVIRPVFFGPVLFNTLNLDDASLPKEDVAVYIVGLGQYSSALGSSGWYSDLGVYGYANRFQEENDYDLSYYQLSATFKRTMGVNRLQLPMRYASIYRGGEDLMQSVSVGSSYNYHLVETGQRIGVRGDFQWRDYADRTDRDGYYTLGSLALDQFFGEQRAHQAGINVAYYQDAADADIYAKKGFRLSLHIGIKLPFDSSLYSGIHYFKETYDGQETLAPEKREDKQRQFVVGIRKNVGANLKLDLNHQITDNFSTFDLYKYDREMTTLGVTYRF